MSVWTTANPTRIAFARRRRGLTQAALATLLEVSSRTVRSYEGQEPPAPGPRLSAIAEVLRFPEEFFLQDHIEFPDAAAVSFRALSRMSASVRDRALGAGALGMELMHWVEQRFVLPQSDLPDVRAVAGRSAVPVDPISAAAADLRMAWGLGTAPIRNLVHLLELHGVRVLSLSIDSLDVDAFSWWHNDTPFMFLNTRKSAERSRFDAAHELAHLVLHRHGGPQLSRSAEAEADQFASAFLMPADPLLASTAPSVALDEILRLKTRWGVSMAAMTYRLHKLGRLSEWAFRTNYSELGRRGMLKKEPMPRPRETSQVLAKVFASLRTDGIVKRDVARDLNVFPEEIDALVFGLTIQSVAAGPGGTLLDGAPPATRGRPRLVSNGGS